MRTRRLVLALAALATFAGCSVCGLIDQDIVVAADDPELGGLIADCHDGKAPAMDPTCQADGLAAIDCACVPLCERVFAIVDADPNRPALQRCTMSLDATSGQSRIEIEYRSVCQ